MMAKATWMMAKAMEPLAMPTCTAGGVSNGRMDRRPPNGLVPLIAAIVIVMPRIHIVAVGTGEIRFDDVLIAILSLVLLPALCRQYRFDFIDYAFFVYIAVGVLSSIVSSIYGDVVLLPSMLFAIRPAEYWLLRPLLATHRPPSSARVRFAELYTCFLAVYVAGSLLHDGLAQRASANTGGPYELAIVAGILATTFYFHGQKWFALLSFLVVVATQSRSGAGAVVAALVLVAALARGTRPTARRRPSRFTTVTVSGLLLCTVFIPTLGISGRAKAAFEPGSWSVASAISSSLPLTEHSSQYADNLALAFPSVGYYGQSDASSVIRFTKWKALVADVESSTRTLLVGLGPSFAGPAVDGYYVRAFAETGILGLLAFAGFMGAIILRSRCDYLALSAVLIVSLNAIFVDAWIASKAMFLLWAVLGLTLKFGRGRT